MFGHTLCIDYVTKLYSVEQYYGAALLVGLRQHYLRLATSLCGRLSRLCGPHRGGCGLTNFSTITAPTGLGHSFTATVGVRQGCPRSPWCVVLVADLGLRCVTNTLGSTGRVRAFADDTAVDTKDVCTMPPPPYSSSSTSTRILPT